MDALQRQYTKPKGTLIIIGGHEDREGECTILKEVARRACEPRKSRKGKQIVVCAVASSVPDEMLGEYERVFKRLGLDDIGLLSLKTVEDAHNEDNARMVRESPVLFFTGGDQLRITSMIGVTPLFEAMYEMYAHGGTIVGTSAGAACMSETMVVSGESDESNEIRSLDMGAGLGLLREVVIDMHFAERGRMGRLLGAVSQNPRSLGIGIDENTAIIVEQAEHSG